MFLTKVVIAVLAAGVLHFATPSESRQLLQAHTHEHGDHAHNGTIVGTRLEYDHTIDILELRGLWLGEGDQYPASVYSIFEDNTSLPDCSNQTNEYNYEHYAPDDEHYIMLSGFANAVDRVTASHRRTTPFRVLNYTNNILGLYNNITGATTCSFWRPYVELRSGYFKAEVINMNMYSRNSTGQRVTTSMNCQVVGDELPGCYTESVQRQTGLSPLVQSASVSAPSPQPRPQIQIPSGSVVSVNIQTYTCRNGECLTLSPKFAEDGHSH